MFAGPNATVLNSAPLVTSNQARERHGLPPLTDRWGDRLRFDQLRPQRLAAPVTVYVEQFSAHPLEADAAHLYGPPDGYLDDAGRFGTERRAPSDRPVYRIELRPEDGLLPLPYMGVRADGSAWDGDATGPDAPPDATRQPFYPDAARVFEEIDRLGYGEHAESNLLGRHADFDFFRVLPSGGYTRGLAEGERTDVGTGGIAAERWGEDFFPYRPGHLRGEPPRAALAEVTNRLSGALATGTYQAALWLDASPAIEETLYWLTLVLDTEVPIVGCASTEWPHGCLGATGDRNLVHAVEYLRSGIWRDHQGRDRLGAVLVDAERVLLARDVQKADARPGGFGVTGGHGGIVATIGDPGPPVLTALPVWRHTYGSDVRLTAIPRRVRGVRRSGAGDGAEAIDVEVKDGAGGLLGSAVPHVSIFKHARYLTTGPDGIDDEVELLARIDHNLRHRGLAGFVVEANAPYGSSAPSADAVLRRTALCGMPVVRVGRGNGEGWVPHDRMRLAIAGANLTATKARMLLMACLLRFGAPPPAADPDSPTAAELAAVEAALQHYQAVFDTH
ncbi:hypothetical protein E1269_24860 [Jiangella asiatica]|uniref:L-asparaginase N-terminal domain-containing protein n=1 Tax=Jiangella asiatica TaxID=2530372 RepID=A0A4V6PFD7_9ACTN|nr:hypothetical protein E1269_24860 [Jiangella asiatica]